MRHDPPLCMCPGVHVPGCRTLADPPPFTVYTFEPWEPGVNDEQDGDPHIREAYDREGWDGTRKLADEIEAARPEPSISEESLLKIHAPEREPDDAYGAAVAWARATCGCASCVPVQFSQLGTYVTPPGSCVANTLLEHMLGGMGHNRR